MDGTWIGRAFTVLLVLLGGAGPPAQDLPKPTVAVVPTHPIPLFNGKDLRGWTADVPAKDANPAEPDPFLVRDGLLVALGDPRGHLSTTTLYRHYRLLIEYRFPDRPGNGGVLVHSSTPRALGNFYPQSIEVQLASGHAGDFWCIQENIEVPDMERRRPRLDWQKFGGGPRDARLILNLTDDSEKPPGEWNELAIEARARTLKVWMNGVLVNEGSHSTADRGAISIQSEGAEMEFRKIELQPLPAGRK